MVALSRTPPHNLDAEQALLGGILLDRDAPLRDLASVCSAGDFYAEKHRKIFAAMLSLLEDECPVDRVSLIDRLTARGDLEAVGGAAYLEELDAFVPTSSNLAYYAKSIHDKARARELIEVASAIAQRGYEQRDDVSAFITEAERLIKQVVADDPLNGAALNWIRLSVELLKSPPPRREYMLKDANGHGVYVQGRVGLFAAPGGTGKTWSLAGCAVAVATGRSWFGEGGWKPAQPGRVLFVMAEEDDDEVLRMLHHTAQAMGVDSDEDLALLVRNVTAKGFAGHGVALTAKDDGRSSALPETAFAVGLRNYVRAAAMAGHPFTLIILDPLSRFAGVDTEKDAPAATRWVQVIETLAAAECGRPSVLVSCHTRKSGEDEERQSADWIRGTTALRDGVRWAAIIEQKKRTTDTADLLTLRIVKAAGVPPQFAPLMLCRDRSHEGCLRVATELEVASHDKPDDATKFKTLDDYKTRVLEIVKPGEAYGKTELVEVVGGNRQKVFAAISSLVREKELREVGKGKTLRVMLDSQGDLGLQVPQVPAQVPAGSQGTETAGSRMVTPPVVPGGNRRNLSVPGASSATAIASEEKRSSTSSGETGTHEPAP